MKVHGKTYDLTGFLHPGGIELLELCKDEPDSTALFESYHTFCDKAKISSIMKKYEVVDSSNIQMFSFEDKGFYRTLQSRVIEHFENKHGRKITRGDVKASLSWLNTVFWIWCLFLFSQYQMLFGTHWFVRSLFGFTSGISVMGLGFNVLHDASHYGVSTNTLINQRLSSFHMGLQMWNQILWAYHHCIRHHQYTGDIVYDPDMRHTMPFLRKSNKIEKQPRTFTQTNFAIKFVLLNAILPGNLLGQALQYHLTWPLKGRLWHMKLPDLFKFQTQMGQYLISLLFFGMMFRYGGIYTLFHIIGSNLTYFVGLSPDHDMFPTHIETDKFKATNTMDWGEIQVRGSADFCHSYKLFTKFMGGINTQIEHHLFPSVCNHYLPELVPIVRKTCIEFNIPYNHIDDPVDVFNSILKTYRHVDGKHNY